MMIFYFRPSLLDLSFMFNLHCLSELWQVKKNKIKQLFEIYIGRCSSIIYICLASEKKKHTLLFFSRKKVWHTIIKQAATTVNKLIDISIKKAGPTKVVEPTYCVRP